MWSKSRYRNNKPKNCNTNLVQNLSASYLQ